MERKLYLRNGQQLIVVDTIPDEGLVSLYFEDTNSTECYSLMLDMGEVCDFVRVLYVVTYHQGSMGTSGDLAPLATWPDELT